MKTTKFLPLLFLFVYTYSNAQLNSELGSSAMHAYNEVLQKSRKKIDLNNEIEGSQYFDETFYASEILYKGSKYNKIVLLRYNAYLDEVELQKNEDIILLNKVPSTVFIINKKKYSFKGFKNREGNVENGYLIELYKNKDLTLYKQEKIKFREAKVARTSLTTTTPAKLVDFINYFVQIGENQIPVRLKNNKNALIKVLNPEFKTELKTYLKNNKFSLKHEKSIIDLCKYSNSLN